MKYCEGCGAKFDDNIQFCPVCGKKLNKDNAEKKKDAQTKIEDAFNSFTNTVNTTAEYSSEDIQKNKLFCVLAYIGILFLVPLFVAKDSPFARYHTNQGLILFIFSLLTYITGMVPAVGWVASAVVSVITLLLTVVGILNAIKGEAKELPLIGKFKILK